MKRNRNTAEYFISAENIGVILALHNAKATKYVGKGKHKAEPKQIHIGAKAYGTVAKLH
jgi:hypothetical protein